MLKKSIFVALCYIALIGWGNAAFQTDPQMPRSERKITENPIFLVKNGIVEFYIILPANSSPATKFAAEELSALLSKATGAQIKIQEKLTGNKAAVLLGENALKQEFGTGTDSFDRDGFVIKMKDNRIVIAGRDTGSEHGTLFGVYEFLERFAGMRFYFPGEIGTIIPNLKNWSVTPMEIVDRPDFKVRSVFWDLSPTQRQPAWYDDANPKAGMKKNWERLRLQTLYIPLCHGLAYLDLVPRFGKAHPEYFALKQDGTRILNANGQLCFSSNVKEEIYQDVKAALTKQPASSRGIKFWRSNHTREFFDLMPNDGMILCSCNECSKYKTPQGISDFLWGFVCDTAERLKKEKIDGFVTFMSYPPYGRIPNRTIPANVLVQRAVNGPYKETAPAARERDDETVRAWNKKLNRKIWLWNYAHKINLPVGIPNMIPRAVGSYYSRMSSYVFGAFMEAESDIFLSNYLGFYIYGKVAWNNRADVEKLLAEHHQLMFGAAAPQMDLFFRILEEKWMSQIVGREIETNMGPHVIPPSRYDIWTKIYSPEEIRKINQLLELAEKNTADDSLSLKRIKFMRKNLWLPVLNAEQAYRKETDGKKRWTAFVPELEKGRTLTIDGKLDEPFWKQQKPLYLLPYKSDEMEVQTRVYLGRDSENLYVGLECDEPQTQNISASVRKQDDPELWRDSSVELFFNPGGETKDYYHIMINAVGSVSDQRGHASGKILEPEWNSEMLTAVRVESGKRWIVEVAIPWNSLKVSGQENIPVNFNRNRILKTEKVKTPLYTWSPFIASGFHDIENFGALRFKPEYKNILKDGEFTGTVVQGRTIGPWSWIAHKKILQDREIFLSGGASLRMDPSSAWVRQALNGLKPDTNYRLSFYIRLKDVRPEKTGSGVMLRFDDGSGKARYVPDQPYTGTMPWTRQEFKIRTGAKVGSVQAPYLALVFSKSSGCAWFDNISVEEISE